MLILWHEWGEKDKDSVKGIFSSPGTFYPLVKIQRVGIVPPSFWLRSIEQVFLGGDGSISL